MNVNIEEFKEVKGQDMAKRLNIANSTLRKYAGILDQKGYRFRRNNKNHRVFKDEDEKVLRLMVDIINNSDWRPHEAADIALIRLSGKTAEQAIEEVSKQKNEIDPADKYVQRIQNIIEDRIGEYIEETELIAERQNLFFETNRQLEEKRNQQIQHITENMATKEDIKKLLESKDEKIATKEDIKKLLDSKEEEIRLRDEEIRLRDEEIKAIKEQNELLKRKGFWAKLFKL